MSIKGSLVCPRLHCEASFTLVPFSLSASVLVVKPDKNTRFSILLTGVIILMLLSATSSRVLLPFKLFFQWCKMIVFGGERSCKHALKWWNMPFVVALGFDFRNTSDFIIWFSTHPSTFFDHGITKPI